MYNQLQYVEVYTLSNPYSHVVYLSLDEYKKVRADSQGGLISMMGGLMTFIGVITVLYYEFHLLDINKISYSFNFKSIH